MKKVLKVIFVLLVVVLIVWLFVDNTNKRRQIKEQKATIHQYEEVYLPSIGVEPSYKDESDYCVQCKVLEAQLEEANNRITRMQQQINTGGENNSYLCMKFQIDGIYYKDINGIQFYTDPACTKKIKSDKEIRFISYTIDYAQAANGLEIYCLLMDNGQICYCPQIKGLPYLVPEDFE